MIKRIYFLTFIIAMYANNIWASTTDQMPWTSGLQKLSNSIHGPVAYYSSMVLITSCGLSMLFFEFGMIMKLLLKIGFGIGIVLGANQLLHYMFNWSGAVIR